MGKSTLQLNPKAGMEACAPQAAINGAMKEAIALTNWPNVNVLASLSPEIMFEISGFRDVCIKAFPIPNKEKEISIMK